MILAFVQVCYNSLHQPFANQGAVKIQNLNSERPALKIVRAVLRDSGIDAEDAVSYSIHRCYCRFKIKIAEEDGEEAFNSGLTLDELEIKDGDYVFFRKIDSRVDEMEVMSEQTSTLKSSSRKRKEGADDDNLQSEVQTVSQGAESTSEKTQFTSDPSNAPAAVNNVSSNLENLSSKAASAARSISKLLGGESWKSQSIGKLGPIQTRGHRRLQALLRLVKTSLEIPQSSKSDRSGLFNSDLVEALTRAYHQRVGSSMRGPGHWNFSDLRLCDYERASELLKGKIEQDGSLERSSLADLDKSALSKPAQRFPLRDIGLSGQNLNTARAICLLWNNDKWMKQSPMSGLSPISLKSITLTPLVRQIAQLTRVKPGEATPDGFPTVVLDVLRQAINQGENGTSYLTNNPGPGWKQTKAITLALKLLKARLSEEARAEASSSSLPSERRDETEEESGVEGRISKRMRIESVLC